MVIVVLLIIVTIKLMAGENSEVQRFRSTLDHLNNNSVVFVGSSRVRRGILEDQLANEIPDQQFVNLGIFNNTFFASYLIGEFLIEKTESEVIFLELSPIKYEFSTFQMNLIGAMGLSVNDALNLLSGDNKLEDIRLKVEMLNDFLLHELYLKDDIRTIVEFNKKTRPSFGYLPTTANRAKNSDSFLKLKDLENTDSNIDLKPYLTLIENLIEKAKIENKRIIFMLPVTFKKEVERKTVIPIYNTIPTENKLLLDALFLNKISETEYLMNVNHFNSKGAKVYSKELARLMKKQGIIAPLSQ